MLNTTTKNSPDQEIIDWLRLSRSQNVGRSTFFHLLKIFGNAKNALENISDYSRKGGRDKPILVFPTSQAEKELELTTKIGAKILLFSDQNYPKLLREILDPPPILTARGDIGLLNKNSLAIVGTRNASFNGCKFAKKIATDLGNAGFVISSGLAKGIDASAHFGALDTGTIAVIAGGIDNIYPKENERLYHEIAKRGVIISEIPFGAPPRSVNFPQRNRIISGVSLGAIIVEATLRSGTLVTARLAIEQNREVFAVPGSPFDPRCQGTNLLIKQGAKLIENIEDILEELLIASDQSGDVKFMGEELGGCAAPKATSADDDIDKARELILSKLGYAEISPDEIIADLQISAQIVNIALVQLELADRIENKNGKVCLKGDRV